MRTAWNRIWMGMPFFFLFSVTAAQAQYQEVETPVKGLLFGEADIFVSLHGFVNAEAFYFQRQAEHDIPSFDLHNFYFSAKAQAGEEITMFAELEYEHGTQDIRLDRGFFDWETSPWATVRIGRFYVPMSYERTHYQAPVRLMTSRPLMVDVAFHEWSDTGLELLGTLTPSGDLIRYDLSVVNGPRGLSEDGIPVSLGEDNRDNNRNKSIVARVNIKPTTGLTFGTAYGTGKYDDAGKLGFKVIEFDGRYAIGRLDLWGEFMKRTGDDEPGITPPFLTGTKADQQGFYLLAAYKALEKQPQLYYLMPMIRYDALKENVGSAGTERVTLGLNYSPKKHVVFKSEYQFTHETGQPQKKNNGAMLSAVIDF
ncbi:MAG: hypothetical protein HY204_01165 [Nitrospirae bacterium]|nr:hypothetical protein [Nitrospirota bacterium]